MNPVFLNPPWSAIERHQTRQRRRIAARRGLAVIVFSLLCLCFGFMSGQVLAWLTQ